MQQGTWTIRPCPHGEASALAAELGISWVTASVLVRRGYGDPERRVRSSPPSRRATTRPARRHRRGLRPHPRGDRGGERICVHGDYDVDGICATALAVAPARARRERRLAPAEPLRRGLRRRGPDDRAPRGGGRSARADGRLRDHGRRGGRAGEGARPRRDRHRPPPARARRCPTARSWRRGRRATRSPSSAGPASPTSCSARSAPTSTGTSTSSRSPRSPTSSRCSTRTARSRARAPRARAHAEARAAGADARGARRSGRVDTGAVGFRLAPRINAAGRLGHPGAALELLLTDDRDEASRLAAKLEELNRERQAVEERIVREAVAQVGEWTESKQRRRAYVLADEAGTRA